MTVELALFPMKYVSISQRALTTGSHRNLEAIDMNGMDTGIDLGRAPCYVKVLKVLKKSTTGFNNTVLVGTCNAAGQKTAVLCADGIKRVLTFAYTHDNYIDDIKEGKVYKQLDAFYHEGTTGQATGNHIHLEIGEGWQYRKYKDKYGNWCLQNLISCEKVFWLLEGYHVVTNRGTNGYNFPWTSKGNNVPEMEDTMPFNFKITKGTFSNGKKYPTRATATSKYDVKYSLNVGDEFWVDKFVGEGNYWIGHMVNGDQAGRWIQLDPICMKAMEV